MAMTVPTMALLFFAAALGGALNAVAGGGSFLSFPSLVFAGIMPISANATSTVALWPGSAASVGAYRAELSRQDRRVVVWLSAISLLGGILGAVLLLRTPQATFVRLVPYLLLLATLLFAFGRPLIARLRARHVSLAHQSRHSLVTLVVISLLQLVIAVYGGYFGGGIGMMMLAALGLMGMENIHDMNALKTLFATCINGVAVLTFVAAGIVAWPQALLMLVGAVLGGYASASFARKIDPQWVRGFVIVVGVAMTVYFFVR